VCSLRGGRAAIWAIWSVLYETMSCSQEGLSCFETLLSDAAAVDMVATKLSCVVLGWMAEEVNNHHISEMFNQAGTSGTAHNCVCTSCFNLDASTSPQIGDRRLQL
jgi:hypothetical protein